MLQGHTAGALLALAAVAVGTRYLHAPQRVGHHRALDLRFGAAVLLPQQWIRSHFGGLATGQRLDAAHGLLDVGCELLLLAALALHVAADRPTGKIAWRTGYAMANVDSVDITVKGKGGHGAYPHMTIDPVVIAAKLVLDLQTIASREVTAGA